MRSMTLRMMPTSYEQDADVESRYVDEDYEEEGESSPSDHAIPGGHDLRNLPLSEWSKPDLWARRQGFPYVPATGMGVDPRFKNE